MPLTKYSNEDSATITARAMRLYGFDECEARSKSVGLVTFYARAGAGSWCKLHTMWLHRDDGPKVAAKANALVRPNAG